MTVSYRHVVARLQEQGIPYAVLSLQNGVCIVVCQRGGRVLGPFLSPEDESILWLNAAWSSALAFRSLIASGDWNLGGERVWIAPEIQFNVQDRRDFWGTLRLPPQMDPGEHVLDEPASRVWRLRQDLELDAHNLAEGRKELRLERLIRRAEDPLRHLSAYRELVSGVTYAGYEQTVVLSETHRDDIVCATWAILQVPPGGHIVMPANPGVEVTSYMEPVDEAIQTLDSRCIRLQVTGERRYKIGVKAAHVLGRLAYYRVLENGPGCLIVRQSFCNPSSLYPEEPADRPGMRGDAVHVINDDGTLGASANWSVTIGDRRGDRHVGQHRPDAPLALYGLTGKAGRNRSSSARC